jgi:hypothetical protein
MSAILLKSFLAVVFVISSGAAFAERFKQYRLLIYAAWLFAVMSGIYLIYGIKGEFDAQGDKEPDVREKSFEYRTAPPTKMKIGDRWGKFFLDGNCVLKFGNSIIHRFSYVGEKRCSYTPLFSPSPSGRYIVVFIPTSDYGYDRFAVVDSVASQVVRPISSMDFDGNRLTPTDSWSKNEKQTVVGKWFVNQSFLPHEPGGGVSNFYGFLPCVLDVSVSKLNCPNEEAYAKESLSRILGISVQNKCVRENTCSLFSEVDSAIWGADQNRFSVSITYVAEPTSNYKSIFALEREAAYSGKANLGAHGKLENIVVSSFWR